jgi:hypothetical protein
MLAVLGILFQLVGDIDQLFGKHDIINQIVATSAGVVHQPRLLETVDIAT